MFKSEKGNGKVILILIVFLIAIIVGSVIFYMSTKENTQNSESNNTSSNTSNNTSENWGLTINGNPISLPCSLDELTKAGVNVNEGFYETLVSSTNQTFSSSYATSDDWKQGISLDLKTGSDISKKEKNVTVSSIDYDVPPYIVSRGTHVNTERLITSSQFHIRNNITVGSKSEDVISTFGTDYEPKTEINLDGIALIYYKSDNSTLCIGWTKGIVTKIEIYTH